MSELNYIIEVLDKSNKLPIYLDPNGVLFVRNLHVDIPKIIGTSLHTVLFHACTPGVDYLKQLRKQNKSIVHYIFSGAVDISSVLSSKMLDGIYKLTIFQTPTSDLLDARFRDDDFKRCKITEFNILGGKSLQFLPQYIQNNRHLKCLRLFCLEIKDWYAIGCAVQEADLVEFSTNIPMTERSIEMIREKFGYDHGVYGRIMPSAKSKFHKDMPNPVTLVQNGNIKELIDMGRNFDVNMRSEDGDTLLHIAVKTQNLEIVKYILSMPTVDLSAKDLTANKTAIEYAGGEILNVILSKIRKSGMSPNGNGDNDSELLTWMNEMNESGNGHEIGRNRRYGIKNAWNGYGVDYKTDTYFGNLESLYKAVQNSDLQRVSNILDANPGIVNARIGPGHEVTALCYACASDDREKLFDLLMHTKGIDVNTVMEHGITPFMVATAKNNKNAVRKLIAANCDLSKKTINGETYLDFVNR